MLWRSAPDAPDCIAGLSINPAIMSIALVHLCETFVREHQSSVASILGGCEVCSDSQHLSGEEPRVDDEPIVYAVAALYERIHWLLSIDTHVLVKPPTKTSGDGGVQTGSFVPPYVYDHSARARARFTSHVNTSETCSACRFIVNAITVIVSTLAPAPMVCDPTIETVVSDELDVSLAWSRALNAATATTDQLAIGDWFDPIADGVCGVLHKASVCNKADSSADSLWIRPITDHEQRRVLGESRGCGFQYSPDNKPQNCATIAKRDHAINVFSLPVELAPMLAPTTIFFGLHKAVPALVSLTDTGLWRAETREQVSSEHLEELLVGFSERVSVVERPTNGHGDHRAYLSSDGRVASVVVDGRAIHTLQQAYLPYMLSKTPLVLYHSPLQRCTMAPLLMRNILCGDNNTLFMAMRWIRHHLFVPTEGSSTRMFEPSKTTMLLYRMFPRLISGFEPVSLVEMLKTPRSTFRSSMYAFLQPQQIRTSVDVSVLATVWRYLVNHRQMWTEHRVLVALLLEMGLRTHGQRRREPTRSVCPECMAVLDSDHELSPWDRWVYERRSFVQNRLQSACFSRACDTGAGSHWCLSHIGSPPACACVLPMDMEDPHESSSPITVRCRWVSFVSDLVEDGTVFSDTETIHRSLQGICGPAKNATQVGPFVLPSTWCTCRRCVVVSCTMTTKTPPFGSDPGDTFYPVPPFPRDYPAWTCPHSAPTPPDWYEEDSDGSDRVSLPHRVAAYPDNNIPSHYLLYRFAADPRVHRELRNRLFLSVQPSVSYAQTRDVGPDHCESWTEFTINNRALAEWCALHEQKLARPTVMQSIKTAVAKSDSLKRRACEWFALDHNDFRMMLDANDPASADNHWRYDHPAATSTAFVEQAMTDPRVDSLLRELVWHHRGCKPLAGVGAAIMLQQDTSDMVAALFAFLATVDVLSRLPSTPDPLGHCSSVHGCILRHELSLEFVNTVTAYDTHTVSNLQSMLVYCVCRPLYCPPYIVERRPVQTHAHDDRLSSLLAHGDYALADLLARTVTPMTTTVVSPADLLPVCYSQRYALAHTPNGDPNIRKASVATTVPHVMTESGPRMVVSTDSILGALVHAFPLCSINAQLLLPHKVLSHPMRDAVIQHKLRLVRDRVEETAHKCLRSSHEMLAAWASIEKRPPSPKPARVRRVC